MRINQRRLILVGLVAAMLLVVLIIITSCVIKPDRTIDSVQIDPSSAVLPFQTATPTPSPAPPTETGGTLETWGPGSTSGPSVITPVPTQTIQVIQASPTVTPSWIPTVRPSATATKAPDDGTLRSGSSGQAVRQLQQRLKDLGYYTGTVDGDFGSATGVALREFQTANGLTADGVAGRGTLTKLNSADVIAKVNAAGMYATSRPTPNTYTAMTPSTYRYLQAGSSGTDVTRLQNRLKELGYYSGAISGSYSADTQAAVLAFQQRNGEWPDGVAGEGTQRMLYSSAALPNGVTLPTATPQAAAIRTLKSGMSGDDVLQLQTRLNELYYYNGKLNGNYNADTQLAVKVFQQRNGLNADGVAGTGTLSVLYSTAALTAPTAQPTATPFKASGTLQTGSTGEEVYRLQERLYDLGYYTGRIDGIYSEAVATAVRAFQAANSLTADGKAGATTQKKMYDSSAKGVTNTANTLQTLREGNQGDAVIALQELLKTYGYLTGTPDGKFDEATVTAVQQLQSVNGLTADGVAGPATLQLLYQGNPLSAPVIASTTAPQHATLKQGMSGLDVMQLQQYLQDFGYYGDAIDGTFGATTFVALQAFQARNELKADGIAGQETLALLFSGNVKMAAGFTQQAQQQQPQVAATARTSMKQGDEGQDVYDLQTRLNTLGYLAETPSGTYGAATATAVRTFQEKNSLKADGVAGPATLTAMYAVGVIANTTAIADAAAVVISNRTRELEEQQASGAIQGSLAGGGVAASYNSTVYFAGGSNGALYMNSGSGEKKIYDSPVRYIHATSKGITFVSGSKIVRVPVGGGEAKTLLQAGGIQKLSLVGDTMCYLEGNTLVRASANGGEPVTMATGVTDFAVDIYQMTVYYAGENGIKCVGLNGAGETLVASTSADQVQVCDSVLFFRSGGEIYRVQNGVSVMLMDADASWMGVYRDKIYFISGDRLYRCDTAGQGSEVFYDGATAGVSFVAGKAYITQTANGPVKQVLPVE